MIERARRQAIGAPLLVAGRDWQAGEERGRLVCPDAPTAARPAAARPVRRPPVRQRRPGGRGRAQPSALELGEAELDARPATADWPARFQRLTRGPLVDAAAAGPRALARRRPQPRRRPRARRRPERRPPTRARSTSSPACCAPRTCAGFLAPLATVAASLTARHDPLRAARRAPEEIAAAARGLGLPPPSTLPSRRPSPPSGAEPAPFRVLVCGSLYLAGENSAPAWLSKAEASAHRARDRLEEWGQHPIERIAGPTADPAPRSAVGVALTPTGGDRCRVPTPPTCASGRSRPTRPARAASPRSRGSTGSASGRSRAGSRSPARRGAARPGRAAGAGGRWAARPRRWPPWWRSGTTPPWPSTPTCWPSAPACGAAPRRCAGR